MYMYVHRFGDWNCSLVVENVPQREGVPVQLGGVQSLTRSHTIWLYLHEMTRKDKSPETGDYWLPRGNEKGKTWIIISHKCYLSGGKNIWTLEIGFC